MSLSNSAPSQDFSIHHLFNSHRNITQRFIQGRVCMHHKDLVIQEKKWSDYITNQKSFKHDLNVQPWKTGIFQTVYPERHSKCFPQLFTWKLTKTAGYEIEKKKKKEKKTARERHFSSEWSGCFPTSVRCQGSKFLKLFQPFKKHFWSSTLALCEELLACGLNSEQPVSLLCFGSLHEFVALTEYAQSFVIWKVRPTEKKSTGFKDVSDYM